MESFIRYLEDKIEGCEMTKAPYRDKIIYQLVLDEYKEQLLLHNVVVPKGTLCETCEDKGQYYAGTLIGYVNCPDCNE